MKILYFTATGNSLYLAKMIGGELLSIPQLIREGRYEIEDEEIGIVFPTYNGDMPEIVEEYLDFAELKCDYLFALTTYGSTPSLVLNRICKFLITKGIQVNYTNGVRMTSNHARYFDMEMAKKYRNPHESEDIAQILSDIENHVDNRYVTTDTGFESAERFKTKLLVNNETCNQCTICTLVCPTLNIYIDIDDNELKFFDECEPCFACLHACPQNRIHLPVQVSDSHYITPHIKLGEIIRSNRQL